MADVVNTDGEIISTGGEINGRWNSFNKEGSLELFELPSAIQSTVDGINGAIDLLNAQLEIGLVALRVAKAWLPGFINPIYDLVEGIINDVEKTLRDFLAVGIYATGDWGLVDPTMSKLEGGYAEYEQRMSARFTDTSDPTRPNIPSSVSAWAIFFFIGVDVTGIRQIVALLQQIVRFFKMPIEIEAALQTPVKLEAKYGISGIPDFWQDFTEDVIGRPWADTGDGTSYDTATVTWELGSDGKSPAFAPMPLPAGFLITVSTIKGGLGLYYDRVKSDTEQAVGANGSVQQRRETGQVLDELNNPVILYGGSDMIDLAPEMEFNKGVESLGVVKKGATRVWAQRSVNDTPIPLNLMRDGDDYLLQRTFYVSMGEILLATEGDLFSIPGIDFLLQNPALFSSAKMRFKIAIDDLPFSAEFRGKSDGTIEVIKGERPSNQYVRIFSVSRNISSNTSFRYLIRDATINTSGTRYQVEYPDIQAPPNGETYSISRAKDLSKASNALTLTYPLEGASDFVRALTAALAILVLSRSDLKVSSDLEQGKAIRETLLEPYAGSYIPQVIGQSPDAFFKLAISAGAEDIIAFRKRLLKGCEETARRIFNETTFSRALLERILLQVDILRTWKWSDAAINGLIVGGTPINAVSYKIPQLTIIESLQSAGSGGLARSPWAANVPFFGSPQSLTGGAAPHFWTDSINRVATPYAPVLVISRKNQSTERKMLYLRSLIPDEVYVAAAVVLNLGGVITRDPGDGAWVELRLGKFIEPMVQYLDMVLAWARGLLDGLKGISNKIEEYINFLESRLLELQQLLKRIQAFLGLMFVIRLPSYSYLIVEGEGLSGIHAGFLSAKNKPIDEISTVPAFTIGVTRGGSSLALETPQTIDGSLLSVLDSSGSPREGEIIVSATDVLATLPDPKANEVGLGYSAGVVMVIAKAPPIVQDFLEALFTSEDGESTPGDADSIEYF